jgi:hypothetical protein
MSRGIFGKKNGEERDQGRVRATGDGRRAMGDGRLPRGSGVGAGVLVVDCIDGTALWSEGFTREASTFRLTV